VDRTRVAGNIRSGLLTAAIAIGAFGLAFLLAIIYIG
jgi:hypothetical protein